MSGIYLLQSCWVSDFIQSSGQDILEKTVVHVEFVMAFRKKNTQRFRSSEIGITWDALIWNTQALFLCVL